MFNDPLSFLSNDKKRCEFLCEFDGHLEQNPAENWFQSKQQVSREIFSVKADLQQLCV